MKIFSQFIIALGIICFSALLASHAASTKTTIDDRVKLTRKIVPIGTSYYEAAQILGEPDEFVRNRNTLVQFSKPNQNSTATAANVFVAAYYYTNGCVELTFRQHVRDGIILLKCTSINKRGTVYKKTTPLDSTVVKTNWDIIYYEDGTFTNLITGTSGLSITNHLYKSEDK